MAGKTHDLEAMLKLCICVLVPKFRLGTRLPANPVSVAGRWRARTCAQGNGVAQASAFPNRVWERGKLRGGKQMDDNFQPVA